MVVLSDMTPEKQIYPWLQLPTGCVLLLCLPSSRTRVCAVNDESDWNAKFDPLSSLSKVPSKVFLICAGNGNANVPQGLYIIVQMYCLYVWNRNAPPPRVLYIIDCANWTWPALEWLPQASLNFSTAFDNSTHSNWVCVVREGDGNANVHRAFCANIELDLFRWWKYKSFVRIIGHQLKKKYKYM